MINRLNNHAIRLRNSFCSKRQNIFRPIASCPSRYIDPKGASPLSAPFESRGSHTILNFCNGRTNYFHTTTATFNNDNNDTNKENQPTDRIKFPRPISLEKDLDLLDEIPLEDVRNFCFIAHVDHGKSSLASRVLEITGNLGSEQ